MLRNRIFLDPWTFDCSAKVSVPRTVEGATILMIVLGDEAPREVDPGFFHLRFSQNSVEVVTLEATFHGAKVPVGHHEGRGRFVASDPFGTFLLQLKGSRRAQ